MTILSCAIYYSHWWKRLAISITQSDSAFSHECEDEQASLPGKCKFGKPTVPSVWPWKPVTVEKYHSWVLHVLFSGYPSLSKHSNTTCKDCNFVRRASTIQNRSYERKECKFRFWSPAGLVYLSLSSELLSPWQFYVAFRQLPSTISRPEFHFWKDAGKGTCATPDSPTKVGSKKTWILAKW